MHIEVDDYLHEASINSLKHEVANRISSKEWKGPFPTAADDSEPWAPASLADDIRKAFYARDASRPEILLSVLERYSAA